MALPTDTGPDYDRPPVVETVLGVQFEPIANFGNAQLGAFWKTLDQQEWGSVTDAPALEPQFEQFGEVSDWLPQLRIRVSQDLRSRLQIKNKTGDRMIQIQNSRVHFNWLGTGTAYPRYRKVREGFGTVLDQFRDFIARQQLGEFKPNQWEVTYINKIPKGTVWETPSDWHFFRWLGAVPTVPGLIDGESFSGEWHFIIPDARGRLHAHWQHGRAAASTEADVQEAIWLTFTTRGPLEGEQPPFDGLDLGHTTIVNAFRNSMTNEANSYWGLRK